MDKAALSQSLQGTVFRSQGDGPLLFSKQSSLDLAAVGQVESSRAQWALIFALDRAVMPVELLLRQDH